MPEENRTLHRERGCSELGAAGRAIVVRGRSSALQRWRRSVWCAAPQRDEGAAEDEHRADRVADTEVLREEDEGREERERLASGRHLYMEGAGCMHSVHERSLSVSALRPVVT